MGILFKLFFWFSFRGCCMAVLLSRMGYSAVLADSSADVPSAQGAKSWYSRLQAFLCC